MNRRLLIVVVCALLVSACASYLVYRAVGNRVHAAAPPPASQVIVAARDLEIGTLIHDSDLKTAGWMGPLPKGAALKREGCLNRGVASAIYEGEPVTESRLAPSGSGGGLAATIPPGMRAIAVKVNEVVGLAGFVTPGMRVDVLITGIPPGGSASDGSKVKTLLENIQVLSAGTNIQKDTEGKPVQVQVVNLLVTPDQAEILSLASNEMHIQLVLRNPMDTQLAKPPGTVMSDLFGNSKAPAPVRLERPPVVPASVVPPHSPQADKPPAPRFYIVEVLNGSVHTQATFPRPEVKP
jgi:pilus assembly protein CpaB